MGMYLIEKGTNVRLKDIKTGKRFPFTTRQTCVFTKEELKWTSEWRLGFQHIPYLSGLTDRYVFIVPKDKVQYG